MFSLGTSLDNFRGPEERLPLIWFIIIFPLLILGTFTYLVIYHHKKLYAPSDYVDEKNFFRGDDVKILNVLKDKENAILKKYPLHPAISKPIEISDSSDQAKSLDLSERNDFYVYLKSIGLTPDKIRSIISTVDNVDKIPEMALKVTSNESISKNIRTILNEFPRSKDDFYKLKSTIQGE